MRSTIQQMLRAQYEAALCMIGASIDLCPDELWESKLVHLTFCQAEFHTLFFTDAYLGTDFDVIRSQPFHRAHEAEFAGYEELQQVVPQNRYEKVFIRDYLAHCREKAAIAIDAESVASLERRPGFSGRDDLSRLEMHVYNIRHVHHHAAQLGLYLRMKTGTGVPWVSTGWKVGVGNVNA